ncbi:alpha-ketoglutarate-dependent taurine dioxygenase [Mycena belliarum]|uniref:Alpha-ketoglutarate-dependent taurine dioxygenase n=1 Tax=Mycena belliarum TaxID=1033014 RepID=A0AAD6UKD8_9AGAR|nr:alpha-ketoglutarate-dependent taurine dioxygenase [Mycena belliae]
MSTTTTTTMTEEAVITYDINLPYHDASLEKSVVKHAQYTPTWNKIWFDPLPSFEFTDPALRADREKSNLLTPAVSVDNITPKMGTILQNLQLTQLSDKAKDELALFISERKVVVFPDQDFLEAGLEYQQRFMDYFGKRNYQPVSGSIPGYPGFHIIHRDGNKPELDAFFAQKTTSCLWHQDVSYEMQPPGYVMLGLLDGPKVGGDTVFAATDEAYKRLSPAMQNFLDGIKVRHSSANMINHTRLAGGLVRKDPVTSTHPLVRVHPVTGERCIFINGEFITGAVGLKDVEWKAISDFLLQHLISTHDIQARVQWSPRTVVMFDNRSTIHTAVVDYVDDQHGAQPRHIFRLAAMAEKPIPVPPA